MNATPLPAVESAEIVLPCDALTATVEFFTARLGFRVELIYPADAPAVAVLSGHGVRLRLEPGDDAAPGVLRLNTRGPGPAELTAPNGTRVVFNDVDRPPAMPANRSRFVLSRAGGEWGVGRAGMLYRDLIPDRHGGRFIASHIRIEAGGPVPDYVHFHLIRFQMIFCVAGWARLVYEDQGEPFVLAAGDCVLQPPRIRHRVLESSPGLEVVEIGCPAEHETHVDHALALPSATLAPARDFGGQRFVRHVAAAAPWQAWRHAGFEVRDTGINAATDGLAGALVVRATAAGIGFESCRDTEFLFGFVLAGTAALRHGGDTHALGPADAFTVPGDSAHALIDASAGFEWLEVVLPGDA